MEREAGTFGWELGSSSDGAFYSCTLGGPLFPKLGLAIQVKQNRADTENGCLLVPCSSILLSLSIWGRFLHAYAWKGGEGKWTYEGARGLQVVHGTQSSVFWAAAIMNGVRTGY